MSKWPVVNANDYLNEKTRLWILFKQIGCSYDFFSNIMWKIYLFPIVLDHISFISKSCQSKDVKINLHKQLLSKTDFLYTALNNLNEKDMRHRHVVYYEKICWMLKEESWIKTNPKVNFFKAVFREHTTFPFLVKNNQNGN